MDDAGIVAAFVLPKCFLNWPTRRVYSYSAYGLTLASDLPLPDLLPGAGRADVHIWIAGSKRSESSGESPIQFTSVSPTRACLTWEAVGDLLIEDGRQITINPAVEADNESLRLFVLGAGLGVLLHQRGLLVLHASGVAVMGQAVGFLGAKGWGKSTTANALYQRGHALIADELLVMHFDDHGRALAMPGSSHMKLWADALVGSGADPESADPVAPGADKYYVRASNPVREEIPVRRLYLLDVGESLCVKPVSSTEAFFGIVPHVYVSRFGTSFLQSSNAAHTFMQLNSLLKKVSVVRLVRRPDLAQISDIAHLVESDCLQRDPQLTSA